LLPVWHEISSITLSPKNDESNCSTGSCYHEVEADPSEDLDPVVVINAEEVHENKADGYEHPHEADGEEKLCGNEEWLDQLPPDDVILLQEHVPAPDELHFVLVALVMEPVETGMPQT